jgi:integrase
MPKRISELTARAVEALKAPGKHVIGPAGLVLVISAQGSRRFCLRYVSPVTGKRRELALGSASVMSLKDARAKAREILAAIAQGADPLAAASPKMSPSFGDVAEQVLASLEGGFANAKHRQQWRNTIATYCAHMLAVPINEVNTQHVLTCLQPIWLAKPETAARVRGRIEKVLDAATSKGLRTGDNPARWRGHLNTILPKRRKDSFTHHAAMPYADVPAFMARLATLPGMSALALRFVILTAARTGEAIGARWSEIDLSARVWTVPAARMKAKREHRVPLSDAAMAILEHVQPLANGNPDAFIFPGPKPGKPLSNMAMDMLLRREKLGITVHGFRSSFRDWAGEETSFPREVCEAALSHVVGDKSEQAYRRGDALQKRRALMDAWAGYLTAEPSSNVVSFKKVQS